MRCFATRPGGGPTTVRSAPPPEPQPSSWSIAAPRWNNAPFVASAVRAGSAPIPSVQVDPQALPSVEPRTGSAIAASLRDLAAPGVREPSPAPQPQAEPERRPEAQSEPPPGGRAAWPDAEAGAIHWQRPALAVGALVLGVGLFGAWAGWEAGNDVAAAAAGTSGDARGAAARGTAGRGRSADRSGAEGCRGAARAEAGEGCGGSGQARDSASDPAHSGRGAGTRRKRVRRKRGSASWNSAAGQVAAESQPAAASPARLPLPNAVVARTIGRIGYSCGQVASTTAIEGGEPGAFKVTCTSGHSYRAAPVRGRYHFRRWGRRLSKRFYLPPNGVSLGSAGGVSAWKTTLFGAAAATRSSIFGSTARCARSSSRAERSRPISDCSATAQRQCPTRTAASSSGRTWR